MSRRTPDVLNPSILLLLRTALIWGILLTPQARITKYPNSKFNMLLMIVDASNSADQLTVLCEILTVTVVGLS